MPGMGMLQMFSLWRRTGVDGKHRNAGFFLYIDLSPWLPVKSNSEQPDSEREFSLAQKLLDAGVGVHPCEEHGEIPGHFRLVFSQDRDTLTEGLRRWGSFLAHTDPGFKDAC